MLEIIDLSQEIFSGKPVFSGLPEVKISVYASHEEWDGITGSDVITPAVNRLEMGEHTGTHVDAISHIARQYRGQSIDTMPLSMFYTEGICLDLSHKCTPFDLKKLYCRVHKPSVLYTVISKCMLLSPSRS
jgi:kynurenine formamidase